MEYFQDLVAQIYDIREKLTSNEYLNINNSLAKLKNEKYYKVTVYRSCIEHNYKYGISPNTADYEIADDDDELFDEDIYTCRFLITVEPTVVITKIDKENDELKEFLDSNKKIMISSSSSTLIRFEKFKNDGHYQVEYFSANINNKMVDCNYRSSMIYFEIEKIGL